MKKFLFFFTIIAVAIVGTIIVFSGHDAFGASLAISPFLANMSRAKLESFADQALSDNYEGMDEFARYDDLNEEDMYEGFDDDLVSFMGSARSFLDEKKSGIYLTFNIVNNCGYTKTVCLNPAYFDTKGVTVVTDDKGAVTGASLNNTNVAEITAAGHHEIDAVIADGLIYGTDRAGITCSSANGRITDHLRFTKRNATRIPEIVFSSINNTTGAIDTTFYSKIMTIRQVFPYRTFGDTIIDLNDFFKVEQYQSGKITVDTHKYGMQADEQSLIFIQIDDNTRVTIKMLIGGISNTSHTLYKKASKAHKNILQGTAGVVPVGVRKNMASMKNKRINLLTKVAFGKKSS